MLNNFFYMMIAVTYRNETSLPVDYHWEWMNNTSGAFSIEPSQGQIIPNSIQTFVIHFEPQKIMSYSSFAILYLDNLPVPRHDHHPLYYGLDLSKMSAILHQIEHVHDPLHMFVPMDISSTTPLTNTAMHCIRTHGYIQQFAIFAKPHVLFFGEHITIGVPCKQTVQLVNHSPAKAHYAWNKHGMCQFSPEKGVIQSGQTITITVTFLMHNRIGTWREQVTCMIDNSIAIHVPFHAATVEPEVHIDAPILDFGIIQQGKRVIVYT